MSRTATHRFVEHVDSRIVDGQSMTKGERTRLRLIKAAAELFHDGLYHDIRIIDIAKQAGVSNGVVYNYFKDKRDITIDVYSEFIRFTQSSLLSFRLPADPQRALPEVYRHYVEIYAANAGLMGCLRHLTEEIPEIGQMVEDGYTQWCTQLGELLKTAKRKNPLLLEGQEAWTIRALSSMAVEFLYDIYVRKSGMLAGLHDQPAVIGELLASVWMRVCLNMDLASTAEGTPEGVTPGDFLPLLVRSTSVDSVMTTELSKKETTSSKGAKE